MALQSIARQQRLYPQGDQFKNLAQNMGCSRLIYNQMLRYYELAKEHNCWLDESEMMSLLVVFKKDPNYIFLKDASSVVLQQTVRDLSAALRNWRAGRAKFPKYKKKGRNRDSVRYQKNSLWFEQLADGTAFIQLAKHSQPLNIVWERPLPPKVKLKNVTVSRHPSGQWYISIAFQAQVKQLRKRKNSIGIDMGIASFWTDHKGNKEKVIKPFNKYEKKLAYLQKQAAKKKLGSNNRRKAQEKVARLHKKIADQRKDNLHKRSTQLIRDNQTICVETLSVKKMMQNQYMSKTLADAAFAMFIAMLEYKAAWYGRDLILIDRFYPSTKMCSGCLAVNHGLKLHHREWDCPSCGEHHDRDTNAAINIWREGLRLKALLDEERAKALKKKLKAEKEQLNRWISGVSLWSENSGTNWKIV